MSAIDNKKLSKTSKELKRSRKCRFCDTQRGLISKYNLYICRRCFKDYANKLGFKKLD
ncbi:MAG TPA: 30S ribosomal protein S14 [archaeon]|jgi:small subunit ribosomal protein S14|nr:30S ribosomal protein S14 [archaeon]